MISGHGDNLYQYQQPIKANFSSNVWFCGTPVELMFHLQQKLHLIGNYPESDAAGLCLKLAESHSLRNKQVLTFNGSVEAFYTIAQAFRQSHSAILAPSFSEYEDACLMHNHQLKYFGKEEWEPILKSGVNLFWIGNPNNPDGTIFSISQIERSLAAFPETVFVVDEAYAAFIPDFQSAIKLTKKYRNLIVVRSMTKCYAIPGLRLGYVAASEKLTDLLREFQQPWSVNALAQEAGTFLTGHLTKYMPDAAIIQQQSINLQNSIEHLDGFQVIPSLAPFFLVEMRSGTAAQLKQFLLENYGILIRDASNFRGLGPNYFRICSRDENDNRLLAKALKIYSNSNKR